MILHRIRSSGISHQMFDDETIVVDLESGSYFSLNRVASALWCLLEEGHTNEELTTHLSRRYAGSPATMQAAVEQFMAEAQQAGLVETCGPSPRTGPVASGEKLPDVGEKPPFEMPALSTYTDMQELLAMDPIHEADDAGWPNAPQAPHESA